MGRKRIAFIVLGRLPKSLAESKIYPFVYCKKFEQIIVFCQDRHSNITNVEYITLPKWLTKIKYVNIQKSVRIFYEMAQLLFYAIKYKPFVINGVYTLPKGFNSFIVSKLTRIKCIIFILGGKYEIEKKYLIFSKLWERLNLFMLRRCDYVFTKGQNDNIFLESKRINKKKIQTYNGCIDIDKYQYNEEKKKIDILFVGVLDKLKGPDRVLKIIKKLKNDFPNIKTIFLGDGEMKEELITYIEKNDLVKNVKLAGYINNPEDYYKKSKLYILPSRTEGLSTAMLESMACGCVPIVSNVGNMTDAAKHNQNSMVVDDYLDIEKFSEFTKELLFDSYKWQRLSEAAQLTVVKRYSVEAQKTILDEIFK